MGILVWKYDALIEQPHKRLENELDYHPTFKMLFDETGELKSTHNIWDHVKEF